MAAEIAAEPQTVPLEAGDARDGADGRELLSMEPLTLRDLPPHKDLTDTAQQGAITLSAFLTRLLTEAHNVDIDSGWTSHGVWQPQGDRVKIPMPAPESDPNREPVDASIKVEQRVKGEGKKVWVARRSCHHVREVEFEELDHALAQDHARKEAEYTPSVYDGNELLKWDAEELREAAGGLDEWRVTDVEMTLYQMFHTMPSALGGLVKLQDRIFHVLIVTFHSTYIVEGDDPGNVHPQAMTFQLPVDIHSLSSIQTVVKRSHTDAGFKRYSFREAPGASTISPNKEQRGRNGNSLIEGFYVSMERLRKALNNASTDLSEASGMHQWDMMTMSDARGITKIASQKTITKGTLDAVTKDVYYVLDYIRQQRETQRDVGKAEGGRAREPASNGPARRMSVQDKMKKIFGQKESDEIQLTKVG